MSACVCVRELGVERGIRLSVCDDDCKRHMAQLSARALLSILQFLFWDDVCVCVCAGEFQQPPAKWKYAAAM